MNWWLAALVALVIAGGILAWVLRTVRGRDRWLRALLAERTRELEAALEELQRKERLAKVGELAGDLARELRSPLGVIKNSAYLLSLKWPSGDDEAREPLDLIENEIERCDSIIKEFLDLARGAEHISTALPQQRPTSGDD